MTLASLIFILFTLCVYISARLTPTKQRWAVLLIASFLFYATLCNLYLILALIIVTAVTFVCGIQVGTSTSARSRQCWLWLGIAANVGVLVAMKYIPFILENISYFTAVDYTFGRQFAAIGTSFYTFQAISYLVDVYFEIQEPERHVGLFSLYLGFFPKLLQGPIERASHLLPQLRNGFQFNAIDLQQGINLFLWGLFKKAVIADRLAVPVDAIYGTAQDQSGISLALATYCYAFQIFFDFSGYTDMALGVGRVFNIRLTQNFNNPYLATSIADFWRRWHISFSTWILDYIFKPLQFEMRRWVRWGTPLALMITFLVSGIWHGASWCFIVWGLVHGLYLAVAVLFGKQLSRFYKRNGIDTWPVFKVMNIVLTFHLVCFAWIFFRSATLADSVQVITKIALAYHELTIEQLTADTLNMIHLLGRQNHEYALVLLLCAFALLLEALRNPLEENGKGFELVCPGRIPPWIQGAAYGVMLYVTLFYGVSTQSFIYFQF